MTGKVLFDTKCKELAEAFLEDTPHLWTEKRSNELAAAIQTTVENYISAEEATLRASRVGSRRTTDVSYFRNRDCARKAAKKARTVSPWGRGPMVNTARAKETFEKNKRKPAP